MRNKIKDLKEQRARVWEAQRANLEEAREKGFDGERRATHEKLESELDVLTAEINAEERKYNAEIGGYEHRTGDELIDPSEKRSFAPGESVASIATPTADPSAWFRAVAGGPGESRGMNEGTATAGGNLVPTGFSATVWDSVRNQSRAIQAGVETYVDTDGHGNLTIPKVTGNADPAWRNEAAAVGEDELAIGTEIVVPRSLALLVKASNELIQDSRYDLAGFLTQHVAKGFAEKTDLAILNGDGLAPNPKGIRNWSGVGSTAAVGSPTYGDLAAAYLDVRGNNYEPSGVILSHRDESTLAGLTDSTGQPLQAPANVANVPRLPTNQVVTNLGAGTNESYMIAGQFDQAIFAVKLNLQVMVLKERYADTLETGFVFYGRYDVVVVRPEAFHVLEGVTV